MAEYLHGVYGEAEASNYPSEIAQGTLPVYIGSVPVHRINTNGTADFDYSAYINKPILIESYRQIQEMGIASDDWNTFTLCEALDAHFMNGQRVVAPIVLINVFNPATHIAGEATTATIELAKLGSNYAGYLKDPLCILDDFTVTGDFADGEVEYSYEGDAVKVVIKKAGFKESSVSVSYKKRQFAAAKVVIKKAGFKESSVSVSYKKAEFAAAEVSEFDFKAAVDMVDFVEPHTGLIPTILIAPSFSEIPANHDIMVQKCIDRAAQKWHMVAFTDIPCTAEVDTRAKAIQWKKDNQYNNKLEKPFYPKVAYGEKEYHLSTIGAYRAMATDLDNSDVPSSSPSNKAIFADRMILDSGETVFYLEYEANELNANGITTANLVKQQLRLWGSHMGNYNHDDLSNIKPEDRFDMQIRMMCYLLNYLQYNYKDEIDESFTRKDVDSVLNSVQTWLDSLVNAGHLLYARIYFDDARNTTANFENGDLTFDLEVTYPIVAKSITFKLHYTRTGLSLMLGGEE